MPPLFRADYSYQLTIWISSIVILFISGFNTTANASREVSEKRECSTCHIMWLKDFDRKDITTLIPYDPKPVVQSGQQDVSSTNEMCFSCHDGFVLDSRSIWTAKKHNHPVGVKPSKKITIPTSKGKTVFPLNDDGKVYCGTCHTAHGVDWNQDESPVFLRVKNVESSMCLACHLEKSTGPKEGNHPVFKQPPGKPEKLLTAGAKFAKDGGVICQSCHSPHASDNKKILVIHNQDSNLCVTCHNDKDTVADTKHNIGLSAPGLKNKKNQTPSESGICGACHLPHGANGPMLWARDTHISDDKAAGRCLACHQEGGPAKSKTIGDHSHPTKVSVKKLGIRVEKGKWKNAATSKGEALKELPLYSNAGHKVIHGDNVSCGTCHDPHAWSQDGKATKKSDGEFVEGDENSSFLRIAQQGKSLLCLNCHLHKKNVISTKHNMFNNADIAKDGILPGGACEQCHIPHNAKGTFLRARDIDNKTESNITGMCKACHSKEGLAKDKTIDGFSHPVGMSLENLASKSTKLPLYSPDGIKNHQNGKVDCATCHDAHTWTTGTLNFIDALKEGDATNSFLRISAAHNSELCLECHNDKKTVLGTDHDLSVNGSDAVNHKGQDVAHSGVCGQCHSVHNATMKTGLWAREPAEVSHEIEKMCLSCHANGKVAEDKIPPQLRHPDHITVWSNKVREKRIINKPLPDIPVFDEDGQQAHVGLITCLSCHDPHKWQPGQTKPGKGKKLEGDAMNSFLRNTDTELIICADCHGADAIFRYKYFHGETSRKKYPLYQ